MTLPDTPNLARLYCPACEPDRDPTREILETRWCYRHDPGFAGLDDRPAIESSLRIGSGAAEGDDCRAFADLLRSGH